MNEESLSALLDGECSPSELDLLLKELNRNPALRERFGRMAMGLEFRRGIRVPAIPEEFAERVMAGLPERPDRVAQGDAVVPLRRRPSWRPLAGLAAAAAVAAVAVLVLKPARQTVPTTATPLAQASDAGPELVELDDENARQLRNYLMAYSQSRAQQGMGGTLGYARHAAYTDDRADGSR